MAGAGLTQRDEPVSGQLGCCPGVSKREILAEFRFAAKCSSAAAALAPRAGPVAQWLEPTAHNGLVGGSSPPGPTTLQFAGIRRQP